MRYQAISWSFIVVAVACAAWFGGQEMKGMQLEKEKQSERDLTKLNEQFAEISLQLTKLELEILEHANLKLSNTFPKASVDKFRQLMETAKWRSEKAKQGFQVSEFENYRAIAEADKKIAELQYRAALGAHQRVALAVPALGLERLKLTAQLARVRYERVCAAEDQPPILLVRWQLQDLRDEIRRVSQRVELYRGNQ